MLKKMMLMALSVGALIAFAAPAVASAEPLLTHEGKAVESVTATQDESDPVITHVFGVGDMECGAIDLSLSISEDTTTTVVGSGSGEATTCHVGVHEVIITAVSVSSIDLTANGTGSAAFTFLYDVPDLGAVDCEFSGSVGLTYAHNSNTITIENGNLLTGAPSGCPPFAEITGSFVLDEAEIH